jgi:transposase, IS5 family
MRQKGFADSGFDQYRKKTRKERFLEEMDTVIPWKELCAAIEPFYPKPPGAERRPIGIDLGRERVPDETTICKFRHLMEKHNPGDQLFHLVNEYLQESALKLSRGTIVDATIIHAPSSTKNEKKERDPDMHQTKKGNQWYFGMKAHIGTDRKTKLIHSMVATAALE